MDSSTPSGVAGEQHASTSAPTGWSEALGLLIGSRIALIELESKAAARQLGQCVIGFVVAALAAAFAWALVLAGGIAALAAATSWPWRWIALAAALLHVVAAFVCLRIAHAAKAPVFPITRAEFHKDRAWLASLKAPSKSNN